MADTTRYFSGYSFRTSSRFGSNVEISVGDGVVTVTGRRIPRWQRDAWIGMQAGLGTLILTRFLFRRRGVARAVFWQWVVAAFGALLLWWPSERGPRGLVHGVSPDFRAEGTEMAAAGYSSWAFRLGDVSDVRVTPWYSRRGLWYAAWLWNLAILAFPGHDRVVVFDVVVSDESPREQAVFAIQMDSAEEAEALAAALRGE
jgi:hypothetical protein